MTNNNRTLYNAYVARKNGGGSAYNYELEPLISNFKFDIFILDAEKSKDGLQEHGAFLVITNKQYIIGYNAGFGAGTHLSAFARTTKDLFGGGSISNQNEAFKLTGICFRNYITARIVYECVGYNENRRPIYTGYINFNLNEFGNKITLEQFETFKTFYNDYNEDIKYVTKKYGLNKFYVRFCYKDKNETGKENISDSLDELYNHLSNNIDMKKIIIDEYEIIIGKSKKIDKYNKK